MMKKIIKSIICVIIILASFNAVAFAKGSDIAKVSRRDVYNVRKGDTLWKISRKYGVELYNVIQANPQIANPNLIYPEDKVTIPISGGNGLNKEIGASMTHINNANRNKGSDRYRANENIKYGSKPNRANNIQSGRFQNSPSQNNASIQNTAGNSQSTVSKNNAYEVQVVDLVNSERAKSGLAPLTLSSEISNTARLKSEDMRDNKYFSHQSVKYGSPFDMMEKFGISYKMAGENIAKGQKSPSEVMKAWMSSEGHRKNIMSASYKEIGVGYVTDSSGQSYWTQQFIAR